MFTKTRKICIKCIFSFFSGNIDSKLHFFSFHHSLICWKGSALERSFHRRSKNAIKKTPNFGVSRIAEELLQRRRSRIYKHFRSFSNSINCNHSFEHVYRNRGETCSWWWRRSADEEFQNEQNWHHGNRTWRSRKQINDGSDQIEASWKQQWKRRKTRIQNEIQKP